jgi:menaquinone-9 beta-reductase
MLHSDVIVIGGGPAGSTCARLLVRAGRTVRVIDRAKFPRDKVCAGWLTPEVLELLELDPAEYRAAGLTFQEITGFRVGLLRSRLLEARYPKPVSYAIRRCEFDEFLLRRSGADICDGTPVSSLRRDNAQWIVNDRFTAPVLVGAGGHFCPVARHLGGTSSSDETVVAQEAEFRIDGASAVDARTPELFFCRDLDGYGWCVRKGDYLNIGIGRRGSPGFIAAQRDFMTFLERTAKAPNASLVRWRGHAYLASGAGTRPLVDDGVLIVGDAAGLAYPESGEGIRPAIESGVLAAETLVAANSDFRRERLQPYEAAIQRRHPRVRHAHGALKTLMIAAGQVLMRAQPFTRRIVIDRWFLRSGARAA